MFIPIIITIILKRRLNYSILSPKLLLLQLIVFLIFTLNSFLVALSDLSSSSYNQIIEFFFMLNINLVIYLPILTNNCRIYRVLKIFKVYNQEEERKNFELNHNIYNNNEVLTGRGSKHSSSSLYSDFKVSDISTENSNTHEQLKEKYYLRPICLFFLVLVCFYFCIYLLSLRHNQREQFFRMFLPSWIELDKYQFSSSHILTKIIILLVDLIALTFSLIYLFKLKNLNISYVLNYKQELFTNSILTFILLGFIRLNSFIYVNSLNFRLIIILLLIAFITMYSFLQFNFNKSISVESMVCKEIAYDFNLLMLSEVGYSNFYNYLKEENYSEGLILLEFYVECILVKNTSEIDKAEKFLKSTSKVKLYDTSCMESFSSKTTAASNTNKVKKYSIINLYNKYIDQSSKCAINFPQNLVYSLYESYTFSKKNTYSKEWNQLLDYTYKELKNKYYPLFKESNNFNALLSQVEKEEEILNKLIIASVINQY